MQPFKALFICSFAIFGLTASSALATTVQYAVTVNTSSALSTDGYIEFQFNPSGLPTQSATASVTNFAGDSVLIPSGTNTGDSSGQLPGTVIQDNGASFNDYLEGMTFGTTLTFNLNLSGPAIDTPNGDGGGTFTLDFLNSSQSGYLFTGDPTNDVPVFTVDINGDGSTTPTTYSSANNGPPIVTFSGPVIQAIPEPATWPLLAAGLALIALMARIKLWKYVGPAGQPMLSSKRFAHDETTQCLPGHRTFRSLLRSAAFGANCNHHSLRARS